MATPYCPGSTKILSSAIWYAPFKSPRLIPPPETDGPPPLIQFPLTTIGLWAVPLD